MSRCNRAFFPFVTPNALAGYLIMIFPLCFLIQKIRWIGILLIGALLLTKSIGGIASLFFAYVIALFLIQKSKITKKEFFIPLIAASCLMGIILSLRLFSAQKHTHPIFSAIMRIDYWEYALKNIIVRFPWTGVGLGNFNSPFSRYAHNSYIQVGAEMGILGLGAFLWLIGNFLKDCKKAGNRQSAHTQRIIYTISILAFLIHNFIDFTFFLPEISLIGWIILGLAYKTYTSI